MGDGSYQFPVALKWDEGPDSLKKIKNKLLLYFQSKNKSNGGECEIRDLDCSRGYILIYFMEEAVRNQVLEKNPHKLGLPNGKVLQLNVQLPEAPNTQSQMTVTGPDSSAAVTVCEVKEQKEDPVAVTPKQLVTTGTRSPHVLIENVLDSYPPEMLNLLVENLTEKNVDKDFYVEMIPELHSAVITFNNETDTLDFIGKFSGNLKATKYNLTAKSLEETRTIRAEGLNNVSEQMIALYFESPKNGGGSIENVDMIPDVGAALITYGSEEAVKSVLTKQHKIIEEVISVYPYYPSLGECLYGKKRPLVQCPDPVEVPLSPYLLEFFSNNVKIKQDIENHLADHHCEVIWPTPDCQKPTVKLSIPSKLSSQYRKMLNIAPTWSKKAHSELTHLISKYEVIKFDVKSSVWEVIKEKVSSSPYNNILFRPDFAAEKVFLVGLSEDLIETKSSFRDLVNKETIALMQVEDDVPLEPHLYKFLETTLQKDSSNLKIKYNSTTRKVKLCGTKEEVLNAKCNILNAKQDLKSRAVHQDPQIIQYLLKVDNEELSSELFSKNHINAMMQVRENDVLLTASSEKDMVEAEKQIKKELACRQISIEDRRIIQIPEWESVKTTMTELLNAEKISMVIEAIPAGAESEVAISGLTSAVDIAYQNIDQFLMDNTVVQENIVLKSEAVMKFIEENKKEILDAITDKVNLSWKKNIISLSGPKQYVKEEERLLRSILSNLHSDTLYIDKPGAKKFCIENQELHAINTRTMFRCAIYLQRDGDGEATQEKPLNEPQCRVTLPDGAIISVHKDDPYHQKVGVAVIAASDDLKPIGLAQTLLNEEVRAECETIIQKEGKLEPGDSIITDAGNLPFKQLIHTVSPKYDKKSSSTHKRLLRKAIKSGLDLAAEKGHNSIVISASSFAACGYPVDICTEYIVASIRQHMDGQQGNSSIRYIHLVDSEDENIEAFIHSLSEQYGEKNVKFSSKELKKIKAKKKDDAANKFNGQMVTTKEAIKINMTQGNIQDATTNVIVNSVGKELDLQYGALSKAIFLKAGSKLQDLLIKESPQTPVSEGCVFITDGCNLSCNLVFHCVVPQWDNGQGSSEKILRTIVNDCLRATEEKQMQSISFPAMGTGNLRFPKNTVAAIMYEEILNFSSAGNHNYLKEVTFMLHPSDTETIKAFSTELEKKTKDPASQKKSDKSHGLFGSVSSPSAGVHEMKIGSLMYQVKTGDITKEDTDVIVNSTNQTFNLKSGVSKRILKEAGKGVEDECAQLEAAKSNQTFVVTSGGNLSCKNIIHIAGSKDQANVKKHVTAALTECERIQAASVAFPAIGTGAAGLSADVVADIMLDALVDFVSSKSAKSVKTVKVVIFNAPMLKDFSASMMKKVQKPSLLTWIMHKIGFANNKTEEEEEEETKAFELRENIEPVIYHLCAETKQALNDTSCWLKQLILKEQHLNLISDNWIQEFGDKEQKDIAELQKTLQVTVNIDKLNSTIKVSGLTKDVLNLTNQIQEMVKKVRERKTKEREAELCSNLVEWKYHDGTKYVPFDKIANLELEIAKDTKKLSLNIDVAGVTYTVVMENKSMRDPFGNEMKCERFPKHENALKLPTYWDSMDKSQLKVITVDARSQEYSDVHAQFAKTCQMKVIKIERVQNLHLYQNYQIKKQSIDTKNGTKDNERQLFHGTDENIVKNVNNNGFNRGYSGINVGAILGNGTYFAVDANYSAADQYSKPDTNGHKYMYLARVLTGIFCVGKKGLIAPPARNTSNSTDLYDSLADNLANPSIFAIFNDVQAYPEYLITFSK